MGILGIGVDVVHLPRIAELIRRRTARRLASRILSAKELNDWRSLGSDELSQQVTFLAVRWSLKEAAYKAMFPHFQPTWKDLTYHKLDAQRRLKPSLVLDASPTVPPTIGKLNCSVSHDGDYVFTSVLVEENDH